MGGMGSGGWNRLMRPLREQTTPLDVAAVCRYRGLILGRRLVWSWTYPCGQVSQITQIGLGEDNGALLSYSHVGSDGTVRPVREKVQTQRLACNFGGSRLLWSCSACGRRCRIIYGWRGRFACRCCHKLTYSSQREGKIDRALRNAEKARAKLGCNLGAGSTPMRPKGMHRATFNKHRQKIDEAETAFCQWALETWGAGAR